MAIKLDKSAASVVVHCDDCPWWSAFAHTIAEGHTTAVRHETAVHPDTQQAAKAASLWRTRHAAR